MTSKFQFRRIETPDWLPKGSTYLIPGTTYFLHRQFDNEKWALHHDNRIVDLVPSIAVAESVVRFVETVEEWLRAKGATKDKSAMMHPWSLETAAGELRISPNGFWVAMRFTELERAKKLLSGDSRLNKYSGKWNCRSGYEGSTEDEAVDGAFQAFLNHINCVCT